MDWKDVAADEKQREIASPDTFELGVVVGIPATGRVLVNCFGTQENLPTKAGERFSVNDRVIVLRSPVAQVVVGRVAGAASPSNVPDVLWVTGWGTANQTLMLTDGTTAYGPYAYLSSYTSPAGAAYPAGDKVAMLNLPSGPVVLGKLAVAQPAVVQQTAVPTVAVTPTAPRVGTLTAPAIDARSFRNSKWRTDSAVVAQDDWGGFGVNTGAWFYGTTISDALRGATVTAIDMRFRRRSGGVSAAQTAHVYRHASATRPAGNVASAAGPVDVLIGIGETAVVTLPVAWGQALVDTGGGLFISGSPYVVLDGLDADPQSGLLRITWQRPVTA